MNKITKVLLARLIAVGAVASIRYIPGEDGEEGGFIATVTKIGHITPAEEVATQFTRDFGIQVIIAF